MSLMFNTRTCVSLIKKGEAAPAGCLVVGVSSCTPKVAGSIPSQITYLGCRVLSTVREGMGGN